MLSTNKSTAMLLVDRDISWYRQYRPILADTHFAVVPRRVEG